jgi:hypothetical protein
VVYGALINLFAITEENQTKVIQDIHGNARTVYIIPYEDICNMVKTLTDGEDDSYRKQTFITPDYGDITHNHILEICKNRFSGNRTKSGVGDNRKRAIEFVKEEVEKEGSMFDAQTDIKIIEDAEGQETESQGEDTEDELKVWADWKRQGQQQQQDKQQ